MTNNQSLARDQRETNALVGALLQAYADSPAISGLIRALGVYALDPCHAFDHKANEQAVRALRAVAAEYKGREFGL